MGWPGPVTHRQHAAFIDWLGRQTEVPSRADAYAMQIAAKVDNFMDAFRKTPANAQPKDMLLKFNKDAVPAPRAPLTEEEIMAKARRSEAIWLAAAGVKKKKG